MNASASRASRIVPQYRPCSAAKKMARLAHADARGQQRPEGACFNTAEGWSWDVSVDIAREVLQRAVDADENLGDDTERFTDPHVADRANAVPRTPTSPRT
jgi:hypothetical protein